MRSFVDSSWSWVLTMHSPLSTFNLNLSCSWWLTLVNPALERLGQEDQEFASSWAACALQYRRLRVELSVTMLAQYYLQKRKRKYSRKVWGGGAWEI